MTRAIFYAILYCLPLTSAGQQVSEISIKTPHYDYKNCKFTIKVIDTFTITNKKYVRVNAEIFNDSPDTLRYGMEDYDFVYFNIISDDFLYKKNEQLSNRFIPIEVPPHKAYIHNMLFECKRSLLQGSIKVKFKLLLTRGDEVFDNTVIKEDGSQATLPAGDVNKRTHYLYSNTITF